MNIKNKWFVIALVFLLSFSCKSPKTNSSQDSYADTFQELKEFIETPDSLLTQEQLSKKEVLHTLISEKVIIKDNQFLNTASKEDFISRGLSEYYYDILEKSLKETNQWVIDDNITNLDSIFQSSKDILFKGIECSI